MVEEKEGRYIEQALALPQVGTEYTKLYIRPKIHQGDDEEITRWR